MLPIIPDELILEILLRLPARSLVQFRRVCKSWNNLISSPQFAKDQLQRSVSITHPLLAYSTCCPEISKIIFCPTNSMFENPSAPTKVVSIDLGSRYHKGMIHIVGSCNGLLCLLAVLHNSVRLWNPCTGLVSEWFQIERYPFSEVRRRGFDPDPSPNLFWEYYGFGYDHVHERYKLLLVAVHTYPDSVARVYTFGANSSMTDIRGFQFLNCDRRCHFVSGTLNWIAWQQLVIIYFDLAKETFHQLSIPDTGGDNGCTPALAILRNCLCLCFDNRSTHYDVWVMKEHGVEQSWTKLLVISHVELKTRPTSPCLLPLYMWENGAVLAIPSLESKFVLYNSNDGQINYPVIDSSNDGLVDHSLERYLLGRFFHIYHESMVSPLLIEPRP